MKDHDLDAMAKQDVRKWYEEGILVQTIIKRLERDYMISSVTARKLVEEVAEEQSDE